MKASVEGGGRGALSCGAALLCAFQPAFGKAQGVKGSASITCLWVLAPLLPIERFFLSSPRISPQPGHGCFSEVKDCMSDLPKPF